MPKKCVDCKDKNCCKPIKRARRTPGKTSKPKRITPLVANAELPTPIPQTILMTTSNSRRYNDMPQFEQPQPSQDWTRPVIQQLQTLNASVRNILEQPRGIYDAVYDIPTTEAVRLPPVLPDIPLQQNRVERTSGTYSRFDNPIYSSSNKNQGFAYDEPLRDFQEQSSYNELVREANDNYNTNTNTQQSVYDEYNLAANTFPGEQPDDIPLSETPIYDQRLESPIERMERKRGRPANPLTEEDIRVLEFYVRASLIKASQRSLEQQMQFEAGKALKAAKRRNPELEPTLNDIKERFMSSGKSI
jgi:hypothetical protein